MTLNWCLTLRNYLLTACTITGVLHVLHNLRETHQNSATAHFEKATAKCFKLFRNRFIENEVDVGIDKLMSAT